MTWVEAYRAEDGGLWAIVHTPQADGYRCIYGEPFYGIHAHRLDHKAEATGLIVALDGERVP